MTTVAIEQQLQGIVGQIRRVRTWLLALSCLRWMAAGFAFATIYVVLYAVIDHRFHLPPAVRIVSLILFLAPLGYVTYRWVREIAAYAGTRKAARFVESRGQYHQQLTAVVEYFEDQAAYPYSKSLAERLVSQMWRDVHQVDLTHWVPKWQARACAAVIAVGLVAAAWLMVTNGTFLWRYWSRLVQPIAAVEPLPATTLTLTSGDIVSSPQVSFTVSAEIGGRVPDAGMLQIHNRVDGSPAAEAFRHVRLTPTTPDGGKPALVTMVQLPLGTYAYRFQADDGVSNWANVTVADLPQIAGIKADMTPGDVAKFDPYSEEVREFTLSAIEGSRVSLKVATTEPVSTVHIEDSDGETQDLTVANANEFVHEFVAGEPTTLKFSLKSDVGLVNDNVPALEVTIRADELPKFAYKTPGSDYLATSVASVPIEMLVTDDTGLQRAVLIVEVEGQPPIRVEKEGEGASSLLLQTHLELEEYNLNVGDTVLVYAEAEDRGSALRETGALASSEMYFIEIKPYRQYWHQLEPSQPSDMQPQGLEGDPLTSARALLEITRAIVKKTQPLTARVPLNEADIRKANGLAKDTSYASVESGRLAKALGAKMSAEQLAPLRTVSRNMLDASTALGKTDPKTALPLEKESYQLLREMVSELDKALMSGGGGGPEEGPERVKLEEQVHVTRFDQKEIRWELEQLATKIAKLRNEQEKLKENFEKFLQESKQREGHAQKTTDEKSWTLEGQQKPNSEPSESQGGGASSRVSQEGALLPNEPGASEPKESEEEKRATPQDRLEMMRSAQAALRGNAEGIAAEADAMNAQQNVAANKLMKDSLGESKDRLKSAAEHMAELEKALTNAYYASENRDEELDRADEAMEKTQAELTAAANALEQTIARTDQELVAKLLEEQAKAASHLAKAMQNSTDPVEQKRLQEELKNLVATGHTGGVNYVQSWRGGGAPPQYITLVSSIVAPADKSDIGELIESDAIRAASYLSTQYWTLAVEARKERGGMRADSNGDATFQPRENVFYEQAARFGTDGAQ